MALSGSFRDYIYSTSASTPVQYYMTVEWSGVQDIANNQTTITANLYIDSSPVQSWTGQQDCSLAVNDVEKEFESPRNLVRDTKWLIGTQTFVVTHDAQGKAEDILFLASFHFNGYVGSLRLNTTYTASATFDLDDMSGKTVIMNAATLQIDNTTANLELTVKRTYTGTITHTLTFGGVSQSVSSIPIGGSVLSVPVSQAQREAIVSLIPEGWTWYYFAVQLTSTYGGKTETSTIMAVAEITEERSKPVVTLTSIQDTNTLSSSTGVFIQGVSILKANFNVQYKNGASFLSSSGIVCGVSANGNGSAVEWTTPNSSGQPGTQELSLKVFDSRMFMGTAKQNITIYPYSLPTYSGYSIRRRNAVESDINIDISGYYNQVLVSGVAKNSMQSATLQYREVGSSVWIDGSSLSLTIDGNEWNVSMSGYGDFDTSKSYEIKITVADIFNSVVLETVLPQGKPVFAIRKNKVGVNENNPQYAMDVRGTTRTDGLILKSSTSGSDKYFYIQVNDSGQITATEVT